MSYKTRGVSFIRVSTIANLTRDPELRVTPKGTAICQFGIAVNTKYKDAGGTEHEEVLFIDVEAWGKQGEVVAKYFSKGKPIYVDGRLKQDNWDDKTTGQKRSKHKIVLERFEFIGGKDSAPAAGQSDSVDQSIERHTPPPRARQGNLPGVPPPRDNIDEDVPF